MNRLLLNDSESLLDDETIQPTLPLLRNAAPVTTAGTTTTTPLRLSPQSPASQHPPSTNHGQQRTAHTAVVSFNDHVEIQHYDPSLDYNDDGSGSVGDSFHFYDSSDRLVQDDSETDDDSSSSYHENGMYRHNLIHENSIDISTDHCDMLRLPMVNTTTRSLVPSIHRGMNEVQDNLQPHLLSMGTSIRMNRPLHHRPMNENLQGYTDLTDFATLTDSSTSDTDSSHGSVLSHGLFGPPPQQQSQHEVRRHSNLAEQLLSSSNVPPLERISIIVDEYDISSSSDGSVVSDLQHQHFIDPNLYPLQHQQQHRMVNDDDDDHINPKYYFEIQSLDSCFLPRNHPAHLFDVNNDGTDDYYNTNGRHPHYRLSILKQRLRDSVMAVPFSLTRFRRDSTTGSSSREETEVSVSSRNDNGHNDIIVHAEAILLP